MLTLKQAIEAKGLKDPKPRSAKAWRAAFLKQVCHPAGVPDPAKVLHQVLIERQGPLFTNNAPDTIGDGPQFSSRGLTDWYVSEYCRINHLKRP